MFQKRNDGGERCVPSLPRQTVPSSVHRTRGIQQ